MDIYNYHDKTKEYITARPEECVADRDPLDPMRFLIPANATTKSPPLTGENEVAVFELDGWVIKKDFRGTRYWLQDRSSFVIDEIGEEPPVGALLEEPPLAQEEILAIELAEKEAQINKLGMQNAAIARVLTIVVDKLLEKGVFVASDFPLEERQMYQSIKAKITELF